LIAANSWFFCTLLGLGIFPFLLLFSKKEWPALLSGKGLIHAIPLLLMLGVLTDHGAGLISGSLRVQAGLAWIGLAGLGLAIGIAIQAAQTRPRAAASAQPFAREAISIPFAIAAIVAVALAIYAVPIGDWDARSIWFFHAKAIYFDQGLHPSEFWANPEYFWSHKDYPKLTSMLAARYADFLPGGWNEYAPKGALVPIFASGVLGLLAAARPSYVFPVLLVGVLAMFGVQLWNGYQDGLLALQGAVAITALARWSTEGERKDLMLGCAALAIALCVKNEGQLLFVVGLCPLFYGIYRHHRKMRLRDLAALILLVPFAAWTCLSPQLPVTGDLEGAGLLRNALARLLDPPELTRRLSLLAQATSERTIFVECLVAYAVLVVGLGLNRTSALIGVSALLYCAGTFAVYLGTPVDFEWHLTTSLDRVMILPTALLMTGIAMIVPRLFTEANALAARTGGVLRA